MKAEEARVHACCTAVCEFGRLPARSKGSSLGTTLCIPVCVLRPLTVVPQRLLKALQLNFFYSDVC